MSSSIQCQWAVVAMCVCLSRGHTTGLFPISCPHLAQYNLAGGWMELQIRTCAVQLESEVLSPNQTFAILLQLEKGVGFGAFTYQVLVQGQVIVLVSEY